MVRAILPLETNVHRNLNENSDLIVKWNVTLTKWNGKYVDALTCNVRCMYGLRWYSFCRVRSCHRCWFFFWRARHIIFGLSALKKDGNKFVIFCFRNHFLKSFWINKQFANRRVGAMIVHLRELIQMCNEYRLKIHTMGAQWNRFVVWMDVLYVFVWYIIEYGIPLDALKQARPDGIRFVSIFFFNWVCFFFLTEHLYEKMKHVGRNGSGHCKLHIDKEFC